MPVVTGRLGKSSAPSHFSLATWLASANRWQVVFGNWSLQATAIAARDLRANGTVPRLLVTDGTAADIADALALVGEIEPLGPGPSCSRPVTGLKAEALFAKLLQTAAAFDAEHGFPPSPVRFNA